MRRKNIVDVISRMMKQEIPEAETILYGSEARGTARIDSDIDLLVLLPDNLSKAAFAKRRIEIFDRLYEIELDSNVNISPLILLKSMWNRMKTPFTCNVLNDGILL